MTATFVVNVEAALYDDGRVLLVERAAGEDHAAGERALVGGTVESDVAAPALETTLRRECREEVGVELAAPHQVTSGTFVADTGSRVLNVVYRARVDEGSPTVRAPEEVAAVDWYDPAAVVADESIPSYTREYVAQAESDRRERGW